MTATIGFAHLVHAEWTKFRTVAGWLLATAAAALLLPAFGLLAAAGTTSTVATAGHPDGVVGHPYVPIGPDGHAVVDRFYFVHRPLRGDGSITVRVDSLTGATLANGSNGSTPTAGRAQPWAKVGLIVKESTRRGSAYAAIMVTGGHGVRMQYNYTGDLAGPPGPVSPTSPRWLRLTRSGQTLTGSASTDGTTWTTVGTVSLTGLPSTVQAGLFAASPNTVTSAQHLGSDTATAVPTTATATLDTLHSEGNWLTTRWAGTAIGTDSPTPDTLGEFHQTNGAYTVTGSGDIAPDVGQSGVPIEHTLAGAFAALSVMVVLGALFVSTEYRRGLIRTSLTLSPRRGRVLAAKTIVLATVTFVTGLLAATGTVPLADHFLRANGNFLYPVTALTAVRVLVGTAALLAVAAVLAMALATILRRGTTAVTVVLLLIVLPYLLATAGALAAGPSRWLLRITPAAAFAIEQTIPAYPQVDHAYTPAQGFYPLAPWAGFAVLCAWTALALGLAGYLLRRRDV